MYKKLKNVDNKWFFSELPLFMKGMSFFVKGDLIILFPLVISLIAIGIFSLRFMFLMFGVYSSLRNVGEMIYWFSHQFYDRKYRPPDWGFRNLDNHAVYILHQTLALAGATVSIGFTLYIFLYLY